MIRESFPPLPKSSVASTRPSRGLLLLGPDRRQLGLVQEEVDTAVQLLQEEGAARPGAGGLGLLPLPLYGSLAPADQQRVFESPPRGKRKVIVATNVAETRWGQPRTAAERGGHNGLSIKQRTSCRMQAV
jgi:hypothetical protein